MKYLLKAFPIPLSMYFSLLTIRLLVVDSPWLEVIMGITLGLYIVSFLVTLTMNVIAKSTKTYHVKGLVTSSMLIKLVEIPAYTFIFFGGNVRDFIGALCACYMDYLFRI